MSNLIGIFILLLSVPAVAQGPDPDAIHIRSFSYSGTGCPESSVAYNLSADGQAITMLFDDFIVEKQGRRSRKDCQVKLGMSVPSGWTYGFFCVDVRGYASLDNRVSGRQQVAYSFGGNPRTTVGNLQLQGPFDDDYQHLTAIPLDQVQWAPCGGPSQKTVTIDTMIEAQGRRRALGLMTVDSVDGSVNQHYGIAWKRCPAAAGDGLLGEYFDNPDLAGDPVVTRVDIGKNSHETGVFGFYWAPHVSPHPRLPIDGWSVRWTGYLVVPEDGLYGIVLGKRGGFRFWLDGELIDERWLDNDQIPPQTNKRIQLQQGLVPVTIELMDLQNEAQISFMWKPPGASGWRGVPKESLMSRHP